MPLKSVAGIYLSINKSALTLFLVPANVNTPLPTLVNVAAPLGASNLPVAAPIVNVTVKLLLAL